MPVAERPANARDVGRMKLKEKRKMGRFVELLVCGVLVMVTSDAAFIIFDCVQNCPVHNCVAEDFDEDGAIAEIYADLQMQKYRDSINFPPGFHQSFDPNEYIAKSKQALGDAARNETNYTLQSCISSGTDWDNRGEKVDPTKKSDNFSTFEDVSAFIARILREMMAYKYKDADYIFSSDDIAYNYKAMFDSVLFISTF